jgi:hypothetical protein
MHGEMDSIQRGEECSNPKESKTPQNGLVNQFIMIADIN